jgi:ubiquinol-cytochrome c reductase iron-sulfur subunit
MDKSGVDQNRRTFLVSLTSILGGIGLAFAAIPFISSWFPSARTRAAGGPIEVDISKLEPGQLMTVEWRGKPVWIIHRTPQMVQALESPAHDSELRDPGSLIHQQPDYSRNAYRSLKPEYVVLLGVCTHLGCTPAYQPNADDLGNGWQGGFYCPCHGSRFDLAGRVFKGVPAPINLEVPPYHFLADNKIIIGVDPENA